MAETQMTVVDVMPGEAPGDPVLDRYRFIRERGEQLAEKPVVIVGADCDRAAILPALQHLMKPESEAWLFTVSAKPDGSPGAETRHYSVLNKPDGLSLSRSGLPEETWIPLTDLIRTLGSNDAFVFSLPATAEMKTAADFIHAYAGAGYPAYREALPAAMQHIVRSAMHYLKTVSPEHPVGRIMQTLQLLNRRIPGHT